MRVIVTLVLSLAVVLCEAQSATSDTVVVDSPVKATGVTRNWKTELRRGRVNFEDTTLHYPKLVLKTRQVVQWFNDNFNTYDTAWVASPPQRWKVMLKNTNWYDNYDCRYEDAKFTFDCKPISSVGAYLSFSGLTVGYSFNVEKFGGKRTTSRRLEVAGNCAKYSVEAYLLENSGEMTMGVKMPDYTGTIDFKHFTGLKRRSWGISACRYFNYKHYSQSAATSCGKRQLRPAGSFMAGINITRQRFDIIVDRMSQEMRDFFEPEEEDDEELEDETLFDYADYCLSAGYGYNLPLPRNWIVNATLMVHPGIKRAHSRASSDGGHNFFSVNGKASVAVAYNHSKFFVGVRGYVDSHFYNTGSYRFRSFIVDVTAIAGMRF